MRSEQLPKYQAINLDQTTAKLSSTVPTCQTDNILYTHKGFCIQIYFTIRR
jgi:hypothetical protein